MKNNVLVFDIETTGLPPKGANYETDFNQFPHIVQIAWYFRGEYHDHIIEPVGYEIPEEVVALHGITNEMAKAKGEKFQDVILYFLGDCQNAEKIVAHNIYFDTSIVKANILRAGANGMVYKTVIEPALDKSKRVDTMMKTIKFVNAKYADGRGGKWPKLEELYFKLFQETFPAHNALEDVKALVRCLDPLVEHGVIEL